MGQALSTAADTVATPPLDPDAAALDAVTQSIMRILEGRDDVDTMSHAVSVLASTVTPATSKGDVVLNLLAAVQDVADRGILDLSATARVQVAAAITRQEMINEAVLSDVVPETNAAPAVTEALPRLMPLSMRSHAWETHVLFTGHHRVDPLTSMVPVVRPSSQQDPTGRGPPWPHDTVWRATATLPEPSWAAVRRGEEPRLHTVDTLTSYHVPHLTTRAGAGAGAGLAARVPEWVRALLVPDADLPLMVSTTDPTQNVFWSNELSHLQFDARRQAMFVVYATEELGREAEGRPMRRARLGPEFSQTLVPLVDRAGYMQLADPNALSSMLQACKQRHARMRLRTCRAFYITAYSFCVDTATGGVLLVTNLSRPSALCAPHVRNDPTVLSLLTETLRRANQHASFPATLSSKAANLLHLMVKLPIATDPSASASAVLDFNAAFAFLYCLLPRALSDVNKKEPSWLVRELTRALMIMADALMPYTVQDAVLPFYTLGATAEAPPGGRPVLLPRHIHSLTEEEVRRTVTGRDVTLQSIRLCDPDHPWSGFHCDADTSATDEQGCHLLSFAFDQHGIIHLQLFAVLVHLYGQQGSFVTLQVTTRTSMALLLFNDDQGRPVNLKWLMKKLRPADHPPVFFSLKVHNVLHDCVHMVLLAAYPQRQCVYWFDPNSGGGRGECVTSDGKDLSPAVMWVQENIVKCMPPRSKLKFVATGAFAGPQTVLTRVNMAGSWFLRRVQRTCGAWTTWMLHLLLKFPHLTPNELVRTVYDLVGGATPAAMYSVIVQFLGDCLRFIDPVLVEVADGTMCIKSRRLAGVQFLPCDDGDDAAQTSFHIMRLVLELHVRPTQQSLPGP